MKYIFDRYSLLDVLSPFLFLISLATVFFFHYYINSYVWKDYRILFLSSSKNIETVIKALEENGIKDSININSFEKRFNNEERISNPFTLKELYVQWFENETDSLFYIYIPRKHYIPFAFLKDLHDRHIPFHLEGDLHLSYVNLISTFILFIFLFSLSARRSLFFFTGFPFLFLSFFIHGNLILSSIFLTLIFNFYIIEILFIPSHLDIKQRKMRIKKNIPIFVILILAILLVLLDTYLSYIYFTLSLIASFSIGYVIEKFKYLFEKEKALKRAHPKSMFFPMSFSFTEKILNKGKLVFLIFIIVISSIPYLLFNFYCYSPLPLKYSNNLSLPMPSAFNRMLDFSSSSFSNCVEHKSGDSLPDLTNYIGDSWAYEVFPYVEANNTLSMPKKDDEVVFQDFYNAGDGMIKEKPPLVFKFDDDFINNKLKNIDKTSIEALLYSEGSFLSAFYNFKFFQITRYNFIAISLSLLFMFVSLVIMIFETV